MCSPVAQQDDRIGKLLEVTARVTKELISKPRSDKKVQVERGVHPRCRRAKHNSADFDVILTGGAFLYRLESASQSALEAAPRSVLVLQNVGSG